MKKINNLVTSSKTWWKESKKLINKLWPQKFLFSWFQYFRPNIFVSNLSQINVDSLVGNKIKLVVLDLDNTLAPFFGRKPTSYALKFINKLKSRDMIVVVASNNHKRRVVNFFRGIDMIDDLIWIALKPFPYKIAKVLKKYNVLPEQTVIIGDQFITDIWAANWLGSKSILVTSLINLPVNKITKKLSFKYLVENHIYAALQKNNMLNQSELSKIIIGTDDEIL
ncbi:HAD superfamily phosphatase (TIGR01668 family) [Mycoplasmoides fastidiosum]|uniref:HAD superfamily phosphatase (TIGR01668 family) n=1 Tax=Mycoplasmoides fastidiosum TaxID=92758 RepID=A0ABU0M064_9BACT|nr:HAD-IIIA family hydrolase [Mycoplasmoides fastidiosum]MDQ0514230.1 HAD superfamily phosphatase (TIGR01668 family) [Mycoplasmoides fastidiosum]UUD37363.1 HAD-IIIA family hydrolase [Mycoplasmoides fastidiosum]